MDQGIEVIKYLTEECKINIVDLCDEFGSKCLKCACLNNQDLEVTKYLVEKCKLVPNHIDVEHACLSGNTEIAIYLIESVDKHELNFSLDLTHLDNWQRIILGLKDDFEKLSLAEIISKLNPLALISRPELFIKYCLRDPMDPMFPMKDFIKYTNDLNFKTPLRPKDRDQDKKIQENENEEDDGEIDFISPSVPVFIYNGVFTRP
jgi:hypothetical protein